MRGGDADGDEQVLALRLPRDDRAVVDRIRLAARAPVLDVALVADEAFLVHVAADVVGVHSVGRHRDRTLRRALAQDVVLGLDVVAYHAAPLADVKLRLPAVAESVPELVPARSPLRDLAPDGLGDARVVRERPEESALVVEVRLQQLRALLVGGLGPVPVLPHEVGGESGAVVRVRLAVRHPGVDPGPVLPRLVLLLFEGLGVDRLEVPEQELVVALAVVRGLREGDAVRGVVGEAGAEAVRLHPLVPRAVGGVCILLDERKEPRARVARLNVRRDALVELVVLRKRALHAAYRLAVDEVGLASDDVAHPRGGEQVSLVRRVDEHLAAERPARERAHGDDPRAVLRDASLAVEELAAEYPELVLALPALEDLERRVRLERPHRVLAERPGALSVRDVVGPLLVLPVRGVLVVVRHVLVELEGESAERVLVPYVRLAESAGGEPADARLGADDHGRPAAALRLDRGGEGRGGRSVDDHVSGDVPLEESGNGGAGGQHGRARGENDRYKRFLHAPIIPNFTRPCGTRGCSR